ncbi:MAG TPA: hypothetical protein VF631_10470 [Allosphingosinicella sp.]|jgi:hypothetical protein|uniref:hypothetical protein n=1 Tax=Allosphingosinicella sp. TaxID=2823234 RepID=UPI002F2994DA
MHSRHKLFLLAALVLVSGCNRKRADEGPNLDPKVRLPFDRSFLVGHWGIDGDCSDTTSFNDDGTAKMQRGDDALWSFEQEDRTLTTTETGRQPYSVLVIRNGKDSWFAIKPPDAHLSRTMTRCAASGISVR